MAREYVNMDTESLKELYSSKAKELEKIPAKGALQQINEQRKMVTDLAIELYKRFHRTLNFKAMDKPVREIKFG